MLVACFAASKHMRQVKRGQVRAGEGESEASGTVLTNPVWKTSTYSGLSTRGRAQVCFFSRVLFMLCCRLAGYYIFTMDVSAHTSPGRLLTHVS